jgi:hypothetical protein
MLGIEVNTSRSRPAGEEHTRPTVPSLLALIVQQRFGHIEGILSHLLALAQLCERGGTEMRGRT